MTRRAGLTLIELLVVLTILVALSGIALRSTIGLEEQARFEATQRTLEDFRSALAPPAGARASDGSVTTNGFVADVGRFPVADASTGPSELWLQGTLPTFGRHVHSQDMDVALIFGWRGPYLRLPVGADATAPLRDGFGNALRAIDANGQLVAAGSELHGLRSVGVERVGVGAGYGSDLDAIVAPASVEASISVEVSLVGTSVGGSRVFLRIFSPNPSAAEPLPLSPVTAAGSTTEDFRSPNPLASNETLDPWILPPDHFLELNLTAGVRAIRAYYDDDNNLDLGSDRASDVRYVSLVPGSNGPYQLTIDVGP